MSDEEIIVLDVVNSTDPTESIQGVANSEVSAVLEAAKVFEARPPDAKTAEKQVLDLIREAAISAKIVEPDMATATMAVEPGPVLILENETNNGL